MFRSNNDDKAKILRGEFGNKSIVCAVEDAVFLPQALHYYIELFSFSIRENVPCLEV